MIPLPNTMSPFVGKLGKIISPWIQYLQQFTQAPPNILDISVAASPSFYTAVEPGMVYITGGTVSLITLTRGAIVLNVTGEKLIPVSINDVVEATYSVLPTMQFIPSYGQRTG